MLKILLAIMISVILSTSVSSADNLKHVDTKESFCDYANGAMTVYSKFKQPSKEQSEKFFSFVRSKWQTAECSSDCSSAGVKAGKEYAYLMNVPMDN